VYKQPVFLLLQVLWLSYAHKSIKWSVNFLTEFMLDYSGKMDVVEGVDKLAANSTKWVDHWNQLFRLSESVALLFVLWAVSFKAISTIGNVLGINSCIINPPSDVFSNVPNVFNRAVSCFSNSFCKDSLDISDPCVKVISNFWELTLVDVITPFTNIFNCIRDKLIDIASESFNIWFDAFSSISSPIIHIWNDISHQVCSSIDNGDNVPSPPVGKTNFLCSLCQDNCAIEHIFNLNLCFRGGSIDQVAIKADEVLCVLVNAVWNETL